jgi:molecular chaperone GrpE
MKKSKTTEAENENQEQASEEGVPGNEAGPSEDNFPDDQEFASEDSEVSDSDSQEDESPDKIEESGNIKDNAEYKTLNEKYLRLYAEFDNYRRRAAKESLDLIQTANADILTKLLPTLENFERAFNPEHKARKLEDFEAGIKMIFNNFKDVLEESGLEDINPEGEEFDPNFHDAMMQQPHDKVEEGYVIQVFQKGYKVKSKILQHAKVIISKGKV